MNENKLTANIITARTVDEGVGKETGKISEIYFETAALCFLDKTDMEKIGVKSGNPVRVTTKYGSVVVKAQEIPRGSNPGLVMLPLGFWANIVCGDDTYSTGSPMYKNFVCTVEKSDEPVLTLRELMKKEYGR